MGLEIVAYYRVSTKEQGIGGLGMEAQRMSVESYARTIADATIVASYAEVETARRAHLRNRPELMKAIAHARRSGATLLIARLDRLARNVLVTAQLLESGVNFVACDNPHANRLTIHILAVLAEHESHNTSARIKAAFAAARTRGVSFANPNARLTPEAQKLGTAAANLEAMERSKAIYADLIPIVKRLRSSGHSLSQVAASLNDLGHRTQRKTRWTRGTVYTLCVRNGLSTAPPKWWSRDSRFRAAQEARTKSRYRDVVRILKSLREQGQSLRVIAKELNEQGYRTHRGLLWNAASLNNLQQRQGTLDRP